MLYNTARLITARRQRSAPQTYFLERSS